LLPGNGQPPPGEPSRSPRHLVRTHDSMLPKICPCSLGVTPVQSREY
jgi:hypothetical protein